MEELVTRSNGSQVYEPVVGPNGKIVRVKNLDRKRWDEMLRHMAQGQAGGRRSHKSHRKSHRKSRRKSRATRRRRY
jgi:hypothetical protein